MLLLYDKMLNSCSTIASPRAFIIFAVSEYVTRGRGARKFVKSGYYIKRREAVGSSVGIFYEIYRCNGSQEAGKSYDFAYFIADVNN